MGVSSAAHAGIDLCSPGVNNKNESVIDLVETDDDVAAQLSDQLGAGSSAVRSGEHREDEFGKPELMKV